MLAYWQTEDICFAGKGKPVDSDIMRDDRLFCERELLKLGRIQDFATWRRVSEEALFGGKFYLPPRALKIFHPPSTAANAVAYGSHSFLTMKVPTSRRTEGM